MNATTDIKNTYESQLETLFRNDSKLLFIDGITIMLEQIIEKES